MVSPAFISGSRTVQADQDDHILDLENGIDFLNPAKDGIAFMKKIGMNGQPVKSYKHEWTETALAVRRETVTLTTTTTTLTVADAYQYAVDDLLKLEDEVIRVSAIASATTLTVVRAQAGTSDPGSTHTAVSALYIGNAKVENSDAGESVTDGTNRLYNYVQTFDRVVELSTHEIAQLSTQEGNPMTAQVKRRYIEAVRNLTAALFYGERYADTSNKRYFAGGLKYFITTNVTAVGGALTITNLDALIKSIVDAGGNPDTIVVSTTQKQKLDALDNSLIRTGKASRVGGGGISTTWQSGVLNTPLEIIVDHTVNTDELWVIDSSSISVKPMKNNGAGHGFKLVDATTPGQDGKKTRILGHYTFQVDLEAGNGLLTGLST